MGEVCATALLQATGSSPRNEMYCSVLHSVRSSKFERTCPHRDTGSDDTTGYSKTGDTSFGQVYGCDKCRSGRHQHDLVCKLPKEEPPPAGPSPPAYGARNGIATPMGQRTALIALSRGNHVSGSMGATSPGTGTSAEREHYGGTTYCANRLPASGRQV
jgi:hypothetical protein